ncbi:MAG: BrnA antitoxin family protein [Pseudomonadota bacterium]
MPLELPKTSARVEAYLKGLEPLIALEQNAFDLTALGSVIPSDWAALEDANGPAWQKRTRISLYVDDAVLKYFRAMGPGYGTKLNWVLRAYVQFRLSKVLKSQREAKRLKQSENAKTNKRAEEPGEESWDALRKALIEAGIDPDLSPTQTGKSGEARR